MKSKSRGVYKGDWVRWEDHSSVDREGLVLEVVAANWHEMPGIWSCTLLVLEADRPVRIHVWDPTVLWEAP